MAGVHAGKVLTAMHGHGMMRGNFEYAMEAFPFWQSYTPTGLRQNCTVAAGPVGGVGAQCSAPFTIGGTFTGVSITPIILRWNFAGTRRFAPWAQGAGGLLWTNHKYPAFGGPPLSSTAGFSYSTLGDNGPNDETSVWNFTPQFGVGSALFYERQAVDRPGCERDPYIERVAGRQEPRGERERAVHVGVQLVEVRLCRRA